jgi:hypothetical protein
MNLKNLSVALLSLSLLADCASVGAHRKIAQQNPATATPDCTIKTGSIYPTVAMNPGYLQIDQQYGRIYFTPAQREQNRFVVFNGTVYKNDCTLMGMPDGLDANGNPEVVNYVMDAAGNFYWVDEYKNVLTRHSAVFDGQPVAGAGDITIANSHITTIDTNSGHYPTAPVFSNVLKQLTLDGVNLSLVTVTN